MQRYTAAFSALLLLFVLVLSGCRGSRKATRPPAMEQPDRTSRTVAEATRDSLRQDLAWLWQRNNQGDPLITNDRAISYDSQNWQRSTAEPYRAPDMEAAQSLEQALQMPANDGLNAMVEEQNMVAAIVEEALAADSVALLPPAMEYIEADRDECYARLFRRTDTLTRRERTLDDMELIRVICSPQITPDLVRQLQQTFQTMGLYLGPIDGVFSPAVRLAMTRFQRSQGLHWGVLTYETIYALGMDVEEQQSVIGLPTG